MSGRCVDTQGLHRHNEVAFSNLGLTWYNTTVQPSPLPWPGRRRTGSSQSRDDDCTEGEYPLVPTVIGNGAVDGARSYPVQDVLASHDDLVRNL